VNVFTLVTGDKSADYVLLHGLNRIGALQKFHRLGLMFVEHTQVTPQTQPVIRGGIVFQQARGDARHLVVIGARPRVLDVRNKGGVGQSYRHIGSPREELPGLEKTRICLSG
jgi:hypothetical protein